MSGPKHTPAVLFGPCPSCEGRGYDDESFNWATGQPVRVTCPDCAGTGKAENSITANEKLRDAAPRLAEALKGLLPLARFHYEWLEANGIAGGPPLAALDAARAALREAGIDATG